MRLLIELFLLFIMRDNLCLFIFNVFDIFDFVFIYKLVFIYFIRKVRCWFFFYEGVFLVMDIVYVLGCEWNSRDVKDC